jgi:hypothetical protein
MGSMVTFVVLIKTRAKTNKILGLQDDKLKIALNAEPISGKANQLLVAQLAKWFEVPQHQIHILTGTKAHLKRIRIDDTEKTVSDVIALYS